VFAGAAAASSIPLSDTTTSTGTQSYGTNISLAVPGSYTYANTFGAGEGGIAVPGTTFGFFDDYVFTISGASANSVTSTINLGDILEIDGLQVALYNFSAGQSGPASGNPIVTGSSSSFGPGGLGGTLAIIPATTLNPGTYELEVSGTVSGMAGGSYSGSLNLAPVPLPAALPLLLSSLGAMGLWGRSSGRRRRGRAAGSHLATVTPLTGAGI